MYRVLPAEGEGLPLPRAVFGKLKTAPEGHAFRVLLLLAELGRADAPTLAARLGISTDAVQDALAFWQACGLVSAPAARATKETAPALPLNQKALQQALVEDSRLAGLLAELARLYAHDLEFWEKSVFAALYLLDGFSPDMILLTASHYAATQGITNARYIQKVMATWKAEGVTDFAAADRQLALEKRRATCYAEVQALLGLPTLRLKDKQRVHRWYEVYGYGREMLTAALGQVLQPPQDLPAYIDGILRAWHARGYTTPGDVAAGAGPATGSGRQLAPEDDLLAFPEAFSPDAPQE